MISFSDALATILLIVPGFIATGIMTFILGTRTREWSYVVIWSLVFSLLSYYILFSLQLIYGSEIPRVFLDVFSEKRTFLDVIVVTIPASILGLILGFVFGKLLSSNKFKNFLSKRYNKTYQMDVWIDFLQTRPVGKIGILLKSGDAWYGDLVVASDNRVSGSCGIVLKNPIFIEKSLESNLNGLNPRTANVKGNILVYMEQVDYVLGIDDS